MTDQKHPEQPLGLDEYNILRFKENAIVRHLLDAGPFDMNDLALMPFSLEDRKQFHQLIGFSECGYYDIFPTNDPEENWYWGGHFRAGPKEE